MFNKFALPDAAERNDFARKLLIVLAILGAIGVPVGYLDDNRPAVIFGLGMAVLIPAMLTASGRLALPRLPRHAVIGLLLVMAVFSGYSQMHRIQNLLWLPFYPMVFFYIAGLRLGSALSAVVLAIHVSFYGTYSSLHEGLSPVPANQIVQVLMAYLVSAALSYFYESIRSRHEDQLRTLAERDQLTGLDNRRCFLDRASVVLAQARRLGQPFCVVLADLDHFKQINDRHGHETGDIALRAAAQVFRRHSRSYDLVARWGGEEFVLLLPQCPADGAWHLAENLRRALSESTLPNGLRLTASFGVASYAGEPSIDAVIARADTHLYDAKKNGRNRVAPALAILQSPGPSACCASGGDV